MLQGSVVAPADASGQHPHWPVRALWTGFIALCLLYAVFAFDYFLGFANGREGLWLRFMGLVVSREYAFGRGSVFVEQHAAYANGLRFMLMHTTMAAVAMALGPFQFITALRERAGGLHRAAGRIYVLAMLLGTAGNLAYLSVTRFDEVYTGPPFAAGLWGLDAMVLATGALAVRAICRRDIARHRAWMALNFSLLLTAPGLRILWVLYGLALPARTQAESNLAITTYLLPACMGVGLLWWSAERLRERPALATRARPGLARLLAAAGALAMALLLAFLATGFLPADAATSDIGFARTAGEFLAHPVLLALWLLALGAALRTGPAAVADPSALAHALPRHLRTALLAAVSGMALGTALGTQALAGYTMVSFWWGLGVLWLGVIALAHHAARSGAWAVARDWATTSQSIALVPLPWLASVALWQHLAGMTFGQAWVTGALTGFALAVVFAHYLNVEVLDAPA